MKHAICIIGYGDKAEIVQRTINVLDDKDIVFFIHWDARYKLPSLKSKYSDNLEMIKVGEAVSNWKDNAEEYQKIQGILVDVKTLMNINVRQEMKEIEKLAKLIEN